MHFVIEWPMDTIIVENLKKVYSVYKKEPGLRGSFRSLFDRKYEKKRAVDDVSFSIRKGELIGFIGPNGAGKTTTLKCLSGLLYPTSGKVKVLGHVPFKRENEFLKRMAIVMGQKSQLWWDLPATESFLLNKEIYEVSDEVYKERTTELIELLDAKDIVHVQVRKLSLGQRMKCELINALVHGPEVLFLDEPTIGLDVVMQKKLRDFIREYNERTQATILLTSHYMVDVKELCERVIVINKGQVLYDGKLDELSKKHKGVKLITVILESEKYFDEIAKWGRVIEKDLPKVTIEVSVDEYQKAASEILKKYSVEDINIEEPPIEDIIRDFFTGKKV